jgi:hypothetical protein
LIAVHPTLSTFLDTRAVARAFSLRPRSLDRWRKDPQLGFPLPDLVIKNRLFWKQETIARFQAEQRSKGTATRFQTASKGTA